MVLHSRPHFSMISLKNVFHPHAQPTDGMTQAEREAIVDLLNYCSYADRNVADGEVAAIADLGEKLQWDKSIDFDYYLGKSLSRVRDVIGSDGADFLSDIRKRLVSPKSRAVASDLAGKLMKADGRVSPEEDRLLDDIRKALR